MQIMGDRDPYFGQTGVRRGSAMVSLDRALVNFYRVSIVTMPLTEAVWLQFAMQVYGGVVSTPILGDGVCRGSDLVPLGGGQSTLFASSDSFSVRRTI